MRQPFLFTFLFSFFSLLLFACQTSNNKTAAPKPKFFDIPTYFTQLSGQLGSKKLEKTILHGDKREQQTITIADSAAWQKEFALFSRIQLNRPSFADQYKIDSFRDSLQQDLILVRYTALNPKNLYTQSVDIYFKDQKVKSIGIINKNHNLLSPTTHLLQYDSEKGYTITQTQQLPFEPKITFEIAAIFK
jgi:hypothetical protein